MILKRVTLGSAKQGVRGIVKGLDAQDNVIVDGVQNATPGNKVQTQKQADSSSESKAK
ncbi:MAG: hypothetical protein LEGION0403_FIIPPAGN_02910 [Legionella sp.]